MSGENSKKFNEWLKNRKDKEKFFNNKLIFCVRTLDENHIAKLKMQFPISSPIDTPATKVNFKYKKQQGCDKKNENRSTSAPARRNTFFRRLEEDKRKREDHLGWLYLCIFVI
jgi:hypothetical protein